MSVVCGRVDAREGNETTAVGCLHVLWHKSLTRQVAHVKSIQLSNPNPNNPDKGVTALVQGCLTVFAKICPFKTKKRANAVWDFDNNVERIKILSDQKFVWCLTRKEKVFANYFSRWRTNTQKSPNRTWSQCLWAPGTWVTASNVFLRF